MERKQESKNIISEVAPEIIPLIFSKLSFLNLLNCKLVCKGWNTSISSLKFDSNIFIVQKSRSHLHCVDLDTKHLNEMNTVASFKLHPKWFNIQILNSCNGLLCILHRSRRERVAILNPMTNEYVDVLPGDRDRIYRYGLGFSPKTKQYKLVRHSFKKLETSVEIFGFGDGITSQWRSIFSIASGRKYRLDLQCVYFNGAMYWIGIACDVPRPQRSRKVILRLNIEDEKFEEIWCPAVELLDYKSFDYCGVCNGSLYLTYSQGSEYHLWKMDEGGLWNREFVTGIPRLFSSPLTPVVSSSFKPIKLCEDGKILCHFRLIYLALYDPKTRKFQMLKGDDENKSFLLLHQMNSFHFHFHLHNILAGDAAACA